jgi:CspA family cold shock protein
MARVKWFDVASGEGAVVSEGGMQAALSRAVLAPLKFEALLPGATVDCEIGLTADGLAVTAVHEVASGADTPAGLDTLQPRHGPVRVKGRVQWFHPRKGFGFVWARDVDALLHLRVLEQVGLATIGERAVVDCDIVRTIKGYSVSRIHAVLDPGAPAVPSELEGTTIDNDVVLKVRRLQPRWFDRLNGTFTVGSGPGAIVVSLPPRWHEAVCKWFSRPKGFGFLRLVDGDEDIFVHMDLLRRSGIRELKPGQRVRGETEQTERGLMAVAIELVWDDDAGHA